MSDRISSVSTGPAILSAEAILNFDTKSLHILHDVIGWEALGYSSIQLSVDILNRFNAADSGRGLFLISRISDQRVEATAKMIAGHAGLDWETVTRYGTRFLRVSVHEPTRTHALSVSVIVEEPFPGEERELLLGIAVVNLILIGIETNVERYAGQTAATPHTIIASYRDRLPDHYAVHSS